MFKTKYVVLMVVLAAAVLSAGGCYTWMIY